TDSREPWSCAPSSSPMVRPPQSASNQWIRAAAALGKLAFALCSTGRNGNPASTATATLSKPRSPSCALFDSSAPLQVALHALQRFRESRAQELVLAAPR